MSLPVYRIMWDVEYLQAGQAGEPAIWQLRQPAKKG